MKGLIFLGMVLLVLANNCQKENEGNTIALDQSFDLTCNEIKVDAENRMAISMDSVLNDSRCPKGCYCFWEGNAEVRFVFSKDHDKIRFVLGTYSAGRTDTLIGGYRIKLKCLRPYPELGEMINQSDYHAELEIIKE